MATLNMYCDQCEQTAHGTQCTTQGVCGKTPNVQSLQSLLLYGVKGVAAYKSHARRLGKTDTEVEAFVEDALFATMTNVNFDFESLYELVLECGRMSLRTLRLLDAAHSERFGVPEVVAVKEGREDGPGILVTGHDLTDLWELLQACEGTGVKVYTHGELLPAHTYPKLRSFDCLVGHYGSAWQNQRWDFERFGGPVVATTNCVVIPWDTNTYLSRLYTMRHSSVPGARRITDGDFGLVIEQAREIGPLGPSGGDLRPIGWHHHRIRERLPDIARGLDSGELQHLFLLGGCDGAETGRNYFSRYAEATPPDALVMTMGCGKYRVRDHVSGTVAGLPRLLDLGQCNDAFGFVQIALALAELTGRPLSTLPITVQLSWFEQKSIAILLALLHAGVKKIAIGPNLPAFMTEAVLARLASTFEFRGVGSNPRRDVAEDMLSA